MIATCRRCGAPNDIPASPRQKLTPCRDCSSPILTFGTQEQPSRWPPLGRMVLTAAAAAGVVGLMTWVVVMGGAVGQ